MKIPSKTFALDTNRAFNCRLREEWLGIIISSIMGEEVVIKVDLQEIVVEELGIKRCP